VKALTLALDVSSPRLRRMQALATVLLVAMLLVLWLCTIHQAVHPGLHWVRAFSEAAAVGATADWYAVTALFRHPLGVPLPHTAIIPRNKERIGENLGAFVEENFLTPGNILRRMEQRNPARAAAQWLAKDRNAAAVAHAVCDLIPGMLRAAGDDDLRRLLDRTLFTTLRRINVSRVAAQALALLCRNARHHELLDRLLAALEEWLQRNQGLIKARFSEASRYTPALLDDYIVGRLVAGVTVLLRDVAGDPEHELRQRFDAATHRLIEHLKTSATCRRHARALVRELMTDSGSDDVVRVMWDALQTRVQADLRGEHSVLREHIAGALQQIGAQVLADPLVQQRVNAWCLDAVRGLVLRFRHEAALLIADVVRLWDGDDVSRKVEDEIGRDLQFIRINGTIVGGLAGVLLHATMLFAH
jgi:uncharacterized membrane-anchored protein YjiN (DUF445 family)